MADKTATQNLTRPQATDSQRDHWQYLKTLALETDQRMTSHWYDVGRAADPPLCVLRAITPKQYDLSVSPRIVFDTVDQDTLALADPAGNGVLLAQAGYWDIGFYLECNGLGSGVNAEIIGRMNTPNGTVADARPDDGTGFVGVSMSDTIRSQSPTVDVATLVISYNGSGGASGTITTVTYAEMWAYKIRDS